MRKIYIIFLLVIFLSFVVYLFSSSYSNTKVSKDDNDMIVEVEKKPLSLNIKSGDVLVNNFEFFGEIYNNNLFLPDGREIVIVLLTDLDGNMLGKKYLEVNSDLNSSSEKVYFGGDFAYNQTKKAQGILEVKNIPKKGVSDIYSYKIKVSLDNKPLNLNEGFVPKDGSPFVSSPGFDPPVSDKID